jgi:hypothetical protein
MIWKSISSCICGWSCTSCEDLWYPDFACKFMQRKWHLTASKDACTNVLVRKMASKDWKALMFPWPPPAVRRLQEFHLYKGTVLRIVTKTKVLLALVGQYQAHKSPHPLQIWSWQIYLYGGTVWLPSSSWESRGHKLQYHTAKESSVLAGGGCILIHSLSVFSLHLLNQDNKHKNQSMMQVCCAVFFANASKHLNMQRKWADLCYHICCVLMVLL